MGGVLVLTTHIFLVPYESYKSYESYESYEKIKSKNKKDNGH